MVRLTFTGDMLSSPRMNQLCGEDFTPLFQGAHKLKNCDYLVGNLETPVAGEELAYTHQRYCFNTPQGYLTALRQAGFRLVSLANNHCLDRDEEGLLATLENCRRAGLDTVGNYATQAQRDQVLVRRLSGIRVAFVNYTYGTNAFANKAFLRHPYMVNLLQPQETLPGSVHLLDDYPRIGRQVQEIYYEKNHLYPLVEPYLEQLGQDVARAKEQADYVVMLLHCGGQYVTQVDPYTQFIADYLRRLGVDIIVGHHQHLIQTCQVEGDWRCVYCLGNFMYDQRLPMPDGTFFDAPLFNAVLHLDLTRRPDGSVQGKTSFSLYTTVCNEKGLPCAVDSYDVYRASKSETYLRERILHYANAFGGAGRYDQVQERYEL